MARTIGQLNQREKEVQRDVIELFESLGCHVIRTSPGRRGGTFQTPGIPDLRVFVPRKRCAFWFETKAANGVQSTGQITFQRLAEACGDVYIIGGTEAAIMHLRAIGLLAR